MNSPISRRPGAAPSRIVAVAECLTELHRPESDLARLLEAVGISDLLVACDAYRPGAAVTSYLDYPDYDDDDDPAAAVVTPIDGDPVAVWTAPGAGVAARWEIPGLHVHRLGLPAPLGPRSAPDLVAAMSELVGFDPEPGVYCLAPAVPAASADSGRAVVVGAAQRIAQVYGLPLLRYRCLELSVVTSR